MFSVLFVYTHFCTSIICEDSKDLSYHHPFHSPRVRISWLCLMIICNYFGVPFSFLFFSFLFFSFLFFSFLFFSFFLLLFFFRDRVSLYSPGCPGTQFVDQAGLELRNPPASASQVLGLKACATTTRRSSPFFRFAFTISLRYSKMSCSLEIHCNT
jgi:hypothetical protein